MPDFNFTIEEVQIEAPIVEQKLDIQVKETTIEAPIVEQKVQAEIVEQEVQVEVQGAIVNYTGPALQPNQEIFTLSASDIANKYLNLQHTPVGTVLVFIESANVQIENRSWQVSGSSISWNGYDIENVLEEGDIISVKYKYQ